jgi:asparagine synthase (glutamine-hydrolysing)
MFAFSLWDSRSSELWLVRDRIGIKPLYYTDHGGRLSFASEIKALIADPAIPREVDEEALFHYLTFATTPAPKTMFRGVSKLPAGYWMRVGADGSRTTQRYWDVWDAASPMTSMPDQEIAESLQDELQTSVALRKNSDRPVGVFLSGGVDSTTNAYLFGEDDPEQVDTFTIGYEGNDLSYRDERNDATAVADTLGARNVQLALTPEDISSFSLKMAYHQDEPLADPVCIPLYYVSKLARDHDMVVCQVGEGADELFHGYENWAGHRSLDRLRRLSPSKGIFGLSSFVLGAAGRISPHRREYLERLSQGNPAFMSGVMAFTEREKRQLLSDDVLRRLGDLSSVDVILPIRRRFEDNAWSTDIVNWMTYADLSLRIPELLMMRVDKMSMAVSLEARVPFLDHKFVEKAMSIPPDVKIRNGVAKAILKKAVANIIPRDVIDRRKQGFGLPLQDWIGSILDDGGHEAIRELRDRSGLLNPAAVDAVLEGHDVARIWILMNLALWWKVYIDRPGEMIT